jgi:N-methylhydantoinase A
LRLAAEDKRLALEEFLSQVTLFTHGTTVATNAMIQGRRAAVGLI